MVDVVKMWLSPKLRQLTEAEIPNTGLVSTSTTSTKVQSTSDPLYTKDGTYQAPVS